MATAFRSCSETNMLKRKLDLKSILWMALALVVFVLGNLRFDNLKNSARVKGQIDSTDKHSISWKTMEKSTFHDPLSLDSRIALWFSFGYDSPLGLRLVFRRLSSNNSLLDFYSYFTGPYTLLSTLTLGPCKCKVTDNTSLGTSFYFSLPLRHISFDDKVPQPQSRTNCG